MPHAEPARLLPELTPDTTPFWTGGAHHALLIARCKACAHWIHPPMPICPMCLSCDVAPAPASGLATVHSFTINHQSFRPEVPVPFVIAIVELPEQSGLRLTTNIIGCAPEAVHIGMQTQVRFLRQDDVWLPLFTPTAQP